MTQTEKNIKIYNCAKSFLLNHLPQGLSEHDLEKYFVGDAKEADSLSDVFRVFAKSAQEYERMPSVIRFDERKEMIGKILFQFDCKRVALMNEEDLYRRFREVFHVTSKDSKLNSWYKWSCSIVDSAKFVNGFADFDDFSRFVKRFDYNKDTRMALPLLISTKIRGIGFALACNALKELGYLDYPKPDVHMMDICEALELSGRNAYDVFEAIVKIAEDNKVTPYEVDKVLWLISSGRYYHDNITDKPRKEEFIACVSNKLAEDDVQSNTQKEQNSRPLESTEESAYKPQRVVARKAVSKVPSKSPDHGLAHKKPVGEAKKVSTDKRKFELDGEIYYYTNGKWIDSKYMSVPSSIVSRLNRMLTLSEDFSEKSMAELIKTIDVAKLSENTQLAIKAAETGLKKADLAGVRMLLPRLTSLYRISGRPQKAIDVYEEYLAKYGKSIHSPSLFTSLAAAYCDLELTEEARKYANKANAMASGDPELISVYARLKSMG